MNTQSIFWGVMLVILGTLLLMREFFDWFDFERYILPVLLIAAGAMLIFRDKLKRLP
jgi:uncharacterized membrane protein